MRHHAETSATMIADLGMPNHTFVHGSELPVCTSSGALCMSSAAAHWSPAVTELVQLVRTRWRENCFVGTETVSIVFRDAGTSANVRLSFSLLLGTIALVGGIAVHMLRRACAGLVTLRQTFVRRCQNCVDCSHRAASVRLIRQLSAAVPHCCGTRPP
jgi:hypothetical protein